MKDTRRKGVWDKTMTRIEISGPVHAKKTTLLVLISDYLESIGVNVVRQEADPQFQQKMDAESDALEGKVHGITVYINEHQT